MKLPVKEKVEEILIRLEDPNAYGISEKDLPMLQKAIDEIDKNEPVYKYKRSDLLLAQAYIHYYNHKDEDSIQFAKASISENNGKYGRAQVLVNYLYSSNPSLNYEGDVGTLPIGNPLKYIYACYKDFINVRRRSRRAEYWIFWLYNLIGIFLLSAVDYASGTFDEQSGIGAFSALFFAINLVPSISVLVRRLQDNDMSGWSALFAFIPFLNVIILVITLDRGTDGANKYGNDPLVFDELPSF